MIQPGALNAPVGVVQLPEHHGAGRPAALGRVVRPAVLFPPEQDAAVGLAAGPGQEFSPGGAEGQGHAPPGTGLHEGGGGPGIGEGDDAGQGVQGVPGQHLFFPVGRDVLPVQGEIDVLRGDEQGIQQLSHGSASMARRR